VTGLQTKKILTRNSVLRKGVKRGQSESPDLHPLRKRGLRAQDLVEFALIFPILILFLFGIIDFGRVFHVLIAISNAAREGARIGTLYNVGPDGLMNETMIKLAATQEAGNFSLKLTDDQITPSCVCLDPDPLICPNTTDCVKGQTLRVEVNYSFEPITAIVFGTDLFLVREMEMMIP